MRSAVTGPHLEPLRTRVDDFDMTVASTAAYLRGLWPELEGVTFQVAQGPAEAIHDDHVDRWRVYHDERRIVFYRLPIVRFLRLQEGEEREERSCSGRSARSATGWPTSSARTRGSSRRGATGTSDVAPRRCRRARGACATAGQWG